MHTRRPGRCFRPTFDTLSDRIAPALLFPPIPFDPATDGVSDPCDPILIEAPPSYEFEPQVVGPTTLI